MLIMITDKEILKVTGTIIKAQGWEGEAQCPRSMAGTAAPLTSHCCILNKLSLMVIFN